MRCFIRFAIFYLPGLGLVPVQEINSRTEDAAAADEDDDHDHDHDDDNDGDDDDDDDDADDDDEDGGDAGGSSG